MSESGTAMAKILASLFIEVIVVIALARAANFVIPKITIDALKSGKVRVSIPHVTGITRFDFHANVNKEITRQEKGMYTNGTRARDGDFWVVYLDIPLSVGDNIYYWIFIVANMGGFIEDNLWEITELRDSFKKLRKCEKSSTISTSINVECAGDLILADNFDGAGINGDMWIIEQRIPTYYGSDDNFQFNSYENLDETRFIKDGILYLKPIPRRTKGEVSGILDLKNGCTSSDENQCYHQKNRVYIIPPVKSARITSKQSFQYGKIDVKAKLPVGDWIIPVIQLQLRDSKPQDGDSPKVVIAYSRGNLFLCGSGEDSIGSQLLYGGPILKTDIDERNKLLNKRFNNTPYNSDFHVYTLEWKPGKMSFYVDSNHYGDVITSQGFSQYRTEWGDVDAPFNKEYILSFGAAVGGLNDFPDDCTSGDVSKPWSNIIPSYAKNFFDARESWLKTWIEDNTALQIDYVQVWSV